MRISILVSLLACTSLLIGCGKKGAIHLPEEQQQQALQSTAASQADLRLITLQEQS